MKKNKVSRRTRQIWIILMFTVLILCIAALIFCLKSWMPPVKIPSGQFGIAQLHSASDLDQDGLDDQADILAGTKAYLETRPAYKSAYYQGGYPNDGHGVCTDVVAFAMKDAGYDLRELVDADIAAHPERYDIEQRDSNIDFRRVRSLQVWFAGNSQTLTTDIHDLEAWQGGDIVIFDNHIGIVSENRNRDGIALVYHHARPLQIHYEEDILETRQPVGHYRIGT